MLVAVLQYQVFKMKSVMVIFLPVIGYQCDLFFRVFERQKRIQLGKSSLIVVVTGMVEARAKGFIKGGKN